MCLRTSPAGEGNCGGRAGGLRSSAANVLDLSRPPRLASWWRPPHGVRIGRGEALAELIRCSGDALKKNWIGWRCYFFQRRPPHAAAPDRSASRRTPLNGALECRFYEYRMIAGSLRHYAGTGRLKRASLAVAGYPRPPAMRPALRLRRYRGADARKKVGFALLAA